MPRGEIYQPGYKPQFSGHQTFPLRYGWLKKAFDAVYGKSDLLDNKSIFQGDDAIARFGVGKNMVASMRYWAIAAGVIHMPQTNCIETTPFGQEIFAPNGLDAYMENPASLWLVHWNLCSRAERTTWHWVFNHYPTSVFDREHLVMGIKALSADRDWVRASDATLKRDVDCFVRTYAARMLSEKASREDALESPLIELGLIRAVGRRDGFRLVRGAKPSLGNGVFTYALMEFWQKYTQANTLSFETIAYEPGSPCRVFLLNENDLVERLSNIGEISNGLIRWSETAGLKQLIREKGFDSSKTLKFVHADYGALPRNA